MGPRRRALRFVVYFRGGDKRDRTADPLLAKQVLSQLSYTPTSARALLRLAAGQMRVQLQPGSGPIADGTPLLWGVHPLN